MNPKQYEQLDRTPIWYERKSSFDRALSVIALCISVVSITLVIAYGAVTVYSKACDGHHTNASSVQYWKGQQGRVANIRRREAPNGKSSEICMTSVCNDTASTVLKYMDSKVEPCEDFYEFACGGFLNSIQIPDDKHGISPMSMTNNELDDQIRALVEKEMEENEPKPFRLAKTLYKSCMNETAIEARGLAPLKTSLQKLGGWPILEGDRWAEDQFDWIKTLHKIKELGFTSNVFISTTVHVDAKNASRYIATLAAAQINYRRNYWLKGVAREWVKPYFNYMNAAAKALGAENKTSTEIAFINVWNFEMELAQISWSKDVITNMSELYYPMTIKELTSKYRYLSWKEYFNTVFPKGVQVDDDEVIHVTDPKYLHDLDKLLSKTPKRVQADYIMWTVVYDSASSLNKDMGEIELNFSNEKFGTAKKQLRWKKCVREVSSLMGISVGGMYVRKHFDKDAKKNITEMVKNIRVQTRKILETADWMDETTRGYALEKADSMLTHLAYPDELLDDRKLEEYYAKLELSEDNYFENILNVNRFERQGSLSRLRAPVDKGDLSLIGKVADVNAYYHVQFNAIIFPAGVLHGALFNNDRPRYMNYGAIGTVIGHEITHAFDTMGRQYDKNGNLVDWWAPETQQKYLNKTQCVIEQYENYTVANFGSEGVGKKTQGENIADNGAVKEAYRAYNEWVQRNGHPEPQLPGLEYTGQQMFWISNAQLWCTKYRPEAASYLLLVDNHSPAKFRVIGSLSNTEEFARDFNCPLGSKMNPKKKCSVW